MKKRSRLLALLGAVFLLSLFLVACGGNDDDDNVSNEPGTNEPAEPTDGENGNDNGNNEVSGGGIPPHIQAMIHAEMPSTDDVIEGGILRFARVIPEPFSGVLHPLWANSAHDGNIAEFFLHGGQSGGLSTDENFLLELGDAARGPVIPEISEDGLTITLTIRDNVYWHDGEPVTAQDWLFAYEVLGSPEYTESGGQRFGQNFEREIVGMVDFHEGNADQIEGIQIISERVLEITYNEVVPLLNKVFMTPLPYHIFADIPIAEMEDSPYVRTEAAIGFGPFILETIVPGESVTFVRNDDFWDGAPILDGVEFRVINPEMIGEELAAGNVDIAHTFQETQFPYFEDIDNVTFLKNVAFVYSYIGFRLGSWDADLGESVLNPDATMADVNLRRAMWMAIDNELVSNAWHEGLRWDASSLIPPVFSLFHDESVQRPPFDVEAANALLDEAGFEMGADGYRMNPDGTPLEINFFASAGDTVVDAVNQYYLTQWRLLHLNIVPDFSLEFTAYNDLFGIDVDYDGIDVFTGAWSTGSNPSPYGLYGRTAAFNRSRYVSERNDELLARIDSPQAAVDPEYRAAAFAEWQAYMVENVSMIPTQYRLAFVPVNNRVVNYRINASHIAFDGWHRVGFTQAEPFVNGQ